MQTELRAINNKLEILTELTNLISIYNHKNIGHSLAKTKHRV